MSYMRHLLAEEGIESFIFDESVGMLYQGIAGIAPRLMVIDDDFDRAVRLIDEAGFKK